MSDIGPHKHWRVAVETSGELIVAIETEMLAGRELSEQDEATVELAAAHLLGFVGRTLTYRDEVGPEDPETMQDNYQSMLNAQNNVIDGLMEANRHLREQVERFIRAGKGAGK